jgi:hypothetical protein
MTEFNVTTVTESLRKAIDAKGPGYVYEQISDGVCQYAVNGEPSCLVGHVIADLAPDEFARIAELEETSGSSSSARDVLRGDMSEFGADPVEPLTTDADLIAALQGLQNRQDSGISWEGSFDEYLSVLRHAGV